MNHTNLKCFSITLYSSKGFSQPVCSLSFFLLGLSPLLFVFECTILKVVLARIQELHIFIFDEIEWIHNKPKTQPINKHIHKPKQRTPKYANRENWPQT